MTYLPVCGRAGVTAPLRRLAFMAAVVLAGCQAAPQDREASPDAEPEYSVQEGWAQLPAGRTWGSTSAVFPAADGSGIWVGERCGENICTGHDDLDPVLLFDWSGNVARSFGKGMIVWPHGIFVDGDNNVWIADARGDGDQGDKGNQILKFSPDGQLLMAFGRDLFDQPSDVLVASDGSIFVADGHGAGGNNRIVKLSADGTFLKEWGTTGGENGEFRDPHALAMDSQGRLFVGDRANSRIQIFDQEGTHLATWTQFGRPSGIFIDANDVIYVADSESNAARNPGWKRGIRIGSARDGWVTGFIPDPEPDPDQSATSGAEGVAADAQGGVYGAEVGPRRLTKYIRR